MKKKNNKKTNKNFFQRYPLIQLHNYYMYIHRNVNTVEPQWLEHIWDHGNLFQIWKDRTAEGRRTSI